MKPVTLLELEVKAASSDLTREDFEQCLWVELIGRKNRKQINQFAKDLGIYPRAANVYYSLVNHFFKHVCN